MMYEESQTSNTTPVLRSTLKINNCLVRLFSLPSYLIAFPTMLAFSTISREYNSNNFWRPWELKYISNKVKFRK